jgi:peptidoglycan/LPS O-acetylase OafA/YrhL
LAVRVGRGTALGLLAAAGAATGAGLQGLQAGADAPVLALLKLTVADCGLCFTCGVGCWYYRSALRSRWFAAAGAGCVALVALRVEFGVWAELAVRPLVLTGAVMFVCLRLPYLGNWGRFGDVSYGVYIYHVPVIQCLIALGWFRCAPHAALGVALLITLALALASWWLIEAPCLAPDSHYVRASRGISGAPHGPSEPEPSITPNGSSRGS